jgi:hypothetical protein
MIFQMLMGPRKLRFDVPSGTTQGHDYLKLLGRIKDKILVHEIPYVVTFTIIQSNVLHSSYSMLLGRPWLRYAKVFRDWGNNTIIIQGMGIVRIIPIRKKLGAPTTRLELVLICYDFHFEIFDEE